MTKEDAYSKYNYWNQRFNKGPPGSENDNIYKKFIFYDWYVNYFYPYHGKNNGYLQNKYGLYLGNPPNYHGHPLYKY
tara:strand:- start:696 stop:926 length:231 start_codon:yes stop_codon:yes gene_type:complete